MKERPILFSAPMVRAVLDNRKGQTRRVVKLPEGITEGPWYWAPPSGRSEPGYADPGVQYWTKRGNHIDPCPYGQPGDRLWVRETWIYRGSEAHFGGGKEPSAAAWVKYPADGVERKIPRPVHDHSGVPSQRRQREGESTWDYHEYMRRWFQIGRPSIHMPRWASRLTLEVTGIRIERLQDITEADAQAEGAVFTDFGKDRWGNQHPGWTMEPPAADQVHCLGTARYAFANLINKINGPKTWDANPWVWVVEFRRAA